MHDDNNNVSHTNACTILSYLKIILEKEPHFDSVLHNLNTMRPITGALIKVKGSDKNPYIKILAQCSKETSLRIDNCMIQDVTSTACGSQEYYR